jgi:hypothetical protein
MPQVGQSQRDESPTEKVGLLAVDRGSEAGMLVLSMLALLVSIASVIVAYFRGDMAAVKASRKLHEEDLRRARLAVLQSLRSEVDRVERAIDLNLEQLSSNDSEVVIALVRTPAGAFETSFVSGEPGVEAGEDLIEGVTQYLVYADAINRLIDSYSTAIRLASDGSSLWRDWQKQIGSLSREKVLPILEKLKSCLKDRIEESSQDLRQAK